MPRHRRKMDQTMSLEDSHPNVLFVIVDDMGVHQMGCHGSEFYETPCLDRLAAESAQFTCAYSASPVCSPARAALYTGMHPARWHLTNYIPGTEPPNPRLLTPRWRPYLPVEAHTLGDAFKAAGYATGHFGKWHLGPDYHYSPGRPCDPESQGFDDVVFTRKPLTDADPEDDPHHIERITDEAIRFMSKPREEPFFCVAAHNALHRPEMASSSLLSKYERKPGADDDACRPVLAAMVEAVDQSVGRLLEFVSQSGIDRNTIVIFTADHGAFGRSSTRKPLRGAKADLYEGGIRVPLMWRWPGRIEPGKRQNPVFGTDVFATLLELAGIGTSTSEDGASLCPTLEDPSVEASAKRDFCWHFPHYHHLGPGPCGAIRSGPWKLIEWYERTVAGANDGPAFELYNLESDPSETEDLATRNPLQCAELASRLDAWRREVGAQPMTLNPEFDESACVTTVPPPPGDPGNPFGE